ncbi:unnamed protein product [Ambrosiozyma monospora]|uniref:Unnamed protein product n=1 Tax=Ambrosiozyma monospora TaxID=43982 RepID=A0A9W6T7H8_AMBMO|nr:unnamed protein product [Ambrosiozyma monospora]
MQSMDEYLQDISEAATVESSIGATITDNGRGMKSAKQLAKEEEIRNYEEENFIRLPNAQTKENKREKMKRARNEFMGEDWSMFTNNREFEGQQNTQGKKKRRVSAWERAKKRARD